MTRYHKYMQGVHNQAVASSIEQAAAWLIEDIIEYLIKTGVRPDSNLLKEIKALNKIKING